MTKVFVTVGTTQFHSLVRFFDRPTRGCEIVIQHADDSFHPVHARGFSFVRSIREWYEWADVVVTHAGAGSVYDLLEQGRRVVVVPNLERADKHQLDLARYVDRNRFAFMVQDLTRYDSVEQLVEEALRFSPKPYEKDAFFSGEFLLGLLARNGPDVANG